MTCDPWLVMSMNGGAYFDRSSIKSISGLTLPPRKGGMISKLIGGSDAFSRCSTTLIAQLDGHEVRTLPHG